MSSAIRVALRIRPERDAEVGSDSPGNSSSNSALRSITVTNGNTVTLHRHRDGDSSAAGATASANITHQYTFDKVFAGDSTQEEVYSSVRDLVSESLRGFNVTIFAFGMTGSGKTYTISGESQAIGSDAGSPGQGHRHRYHQSASPAAHVPSYSAPTAATGTASDPSSAGIVPRTVHHVFTELRKEAAQHRESIAMVFVTFVELYNNTFYDLLANDVPTDYNNNTASGHGTGGGLKLHDHPTRGMQLSGSPTLRMPVASAEEALALINRGYKLRATAATNLNDRSSRSHTVLCMEVVTSGRDVPAVGDAGAEEAGADVGADPKPATTTTRYGKINLVDLAGSERVKLSGAEGQTLEEAKQINKALSVLGDVLNSLSKKQTEKDKRGGSNLSHIPYRNSKLTMLLKDSLGGNAKTMMIATIRLSARFYQQTLTSLQYAARARHIRCNPVQNVAIGNGQGDGNDPDSEVQKHLREVHRLRGRLEERTREFDELKSRLEQLEEERKQRLQAESTTGASANAGTGSGLERGTTAAGGSSILQSLDPRDPEYAAKFSAAAAAETALVEQYQRQIDSLHLRNEQEHKQLQEKMKYVIHSHEGDMVLKEKAYLSLEHELQFAQSRTTALIREKDRAVCSVQELEKQNQLLRQENMQWRNDNLQLKAVMQGMQVRTGDLERQLISSQDAAAAAAMNAADREQFVMALQKLTLSRGKHRASAIEQKQRADKLQESVDELMVQYAQSTALLATKNTEMTALQKQVAEQEELLKAAVARIRGLGPQSDGSAASAGGGAADTEKKEKARATDASADAAAASASAIIIASTEMSAQELASMQLQLDEKEAELAKANTVIAEYKECSEFVAEEHAKAQEAAKTQLAQAEALASSMSVQAEAEARAQAHLQAQAHAKADALGATVEALEVELAERRAKETEMREHALGMEDKRATLLRQLSAAQGENLQLGELNQTLRAQLEAAEAEAEVLRQELLQAQQEKDIAETETGDDTTEKEAAPEPESEQDSGGDSPRTQNKSLLGTISALKEHELGLFSTLEDKLSLLDAARTKLHKLKSLSMAAESGSKRSKHEPPSPPSSPGVDLDALEKVTSTLRSSLRNAEQKAESRYIEMLSSRQQITELQIRLEATRAALAMEKETSQAALQSVAQLREEHVIEIEEVTNLVRGRLAARQVARSQDFESSSAGLALGDEAPLMNEECEEEEADVERGNEPDWVDAEEGVLLGESGAEEEQEEEEEDTVCSDDFVFAQQPPENE